MSVATITTTTTTTTSVNIIVGGYYNTHIPEWFQWMRYLSFISYTLSALAEVEYTLGDPFMYVSSLSHYS